MEEDAEHFLIEYVNKLSGNKMVQKLLSYYSVCKHVIFYAFEELIDIVLNYLFFYTSSFEI
jgi:hypothetical protein